ncbi:MAG TPA: tripartite tricarboxylate transporter permease [Thermodesulfobacteriota bacterium]|jgi:putative tricarboxylic transport membrane protein|nr:tripartite tricarboxylate transporter permease [Thermodesulfobacteriota bacterium]
MDILHHILYGLGVAVQPLNLLFCFIGVLIGTLVGVLPGLGPVAAISLLLPATFRASPVASIIMLSGIYYGAMYGGSTTSILVNIPGEAASVVTCFDGYQMARKGRAGPALGIAAFGSFIAGTFGVVGLAFMAPPLAAMALKFGPPEYFSLMVLGLTVLTFLAGGSMLKSLMMACFGVVVGNVGLDLITARPRFTFGWDILLDGVGLIPVVMGLFGISEVLLNVEERLSEREIFKTKFKGLLPNLQDWKESIWPIIRGSVLGFFLGILPGGGAVISSFVSYGVEKKLSKHPEEFGKGAIAGVAGPESANNSATAGAFIPLLTLGLPSNAVMAILLGALMIYNMPPGPKLITSHPDLFWGVISSMYIGNIMLLVLNLPLIGVWVKILKVPYPVLFPLILLFCLIGAYSLNNNPAEIGLMLIFGILGYLMKKFKYDGAPLVLAMVLGPLMDNSLRQSLLMSGGSGTIFFTRPICLIIFGMVAIILLLPVLPRISRMRKTVGESD